MSPQKRLQQIGDRKKNLIMYFLAYLAEGPLAERLAELEVGAGKLPGGVQRQLVFGHRGERRALGAEPGVPVVNLVEHFMESNGFSVRIV